MLEWLSWTMRLFARSARGRKAEERKKQGELRRAPSEQGDCVSDGTSS